MAKARPARTLKTGSVPVVLMQRAWRDNPTYKDVPFVIYHYPRQYFDEIRGGEKFVYYRPSRGAPQTEASTYFGCGVLGEVTPDPDDPDHRFVDIEKPIPFARPVTELARNLLIFR